MDIRVGLIAILALLFSLSVHEFSHALAAYLMGDKTAQRLGRMTLNPLAHLDWFGSVLLPLMAIITGFPVIGWAKPVPYNPYNLRYKRWGPALVASAGPISNFLSAVVYILMLIGVLTYTPLAPGNLLVVFLYQLVIINVVLGVFNLIPIPPLDGSALFEAILHKPRHRKLLFLLQTKGPTLLILLIVLDSFSPRPILGSIFNFVIDFFFRLFGM